MLIGDIGLHREAQEWLTTIERGGRGPKVVFQQTDVTAWDQLERLFDVFVAKFDERAPDIVVAGAGIYEASSAGFWDDRDKASHYKLLDVNLLHPIKLTRIAIRRMRQAQKSGVILHESSIVAQKPSPVLPLYAISKAALSHFVRSMAPLDEMCGIKVVAVAPGSVDSAKNCDDLTDRRRRVVDTPLFRDHPQARDQIDYEKDFILPQVEIVKAMLAVAMNPKYQAGTVLEINDIDGWREVQMFNDPGPQGQSKNPRMKAAEAISLVKRALEADSAGPPSKASKL